MVKRLDKPVTLICNKRNADHTAWAGPAGDRVRRHLHQKNDNAGGITQNHPTAPKSARSGRVGDLVWMQETLVSFKDVQKSYDGETLVVKNLNVDIARGEF